ncbi:MAG: glycoside hydrolase family 108 protein [Alphaproteobacteria bacterium]
MQDALFRQAIQTVMYHEGGVANDPDDPGGATKWGISLRLLKKIGAIDAVDASSAISADIDLDGDIDADDLKALPVSQAVEIYRTRFWERYRYGQLHAPAAVKVFDLAVNMGPRQAHKCLQRAIRANEERVIEDGILGPVTLRMANGIEPARLLPALRSEAAGFYRMLAAEKPRLRKFLQGWLNRAYD